MSAVAGSGSSPQVQREFAKWICEAKHTFTKPKQAKAIAAERIARDPSIKALYVYRCPACRLFHLTRKPNRYGAIARRPEAQGADHE